MTTVQTQPESSPPALPEIPPWICLAVMAILTLGIFGDTLFLHPHQVLSDGSADLAHYFVPWRYFGFGELKAGRLALWNPHYYGGTPFFGNFQSALLYPLNVPYLILPLEAAINWTIALHVFLGGVFTFYWVRHRGLHSLACLLSAMMFMFCGPHFLQVQVGHLPNLCTLVWAPLLFLAIDQILDRPGPGPCLLGMFAFAMSIFAGHPQYVFYMGVGAGIYAFLNLIQARPRGRVLLGFACVVAGGIALSAIQLFTGMDEGRELTRNVGMSFDFASTFSFPPENLLTLVAPWCFGGAEQVPYWGRWYVSEVSLFVSVMGLVLAAYGAIAGAGRTRRFSVVLVICTLLLAMGGYTPLFQFLFDHVPGFDLFRGMDKFIWLSALFLSMLAGIGMDQLLRGRVVSWWMVGGVAGAGLLLCSLVLMAQQLDWWEGMLRQIKPRETPFMPVQVYTRPRLVAETSAFFVNHLAHGILLLLVAAGCLAATHLHRRFACIAMLAVAAVELLVFAGASTMTFTIGPPYPADIQAILNNNPGDYRIRWDNPNSALMAGTYDIGGDDPSDLLRYERFLDYVKGVDYKKGIYVPKAWVWLASGLRILRCHYLFWAGKEDYTTIRDPLPRLLLVDKYRIMTNYHEMFPILVNTNFYPDKEVILESPPNPAPQPSPEKGDVKLLASSTDSLTVEADTKTPRILMITDAYSKGWRALALPGSSQTHYDILPADHCLRAIPLGAGHHLLKIEYSPLGFRIGKVVSIIAWPIFAAMAALAVRMARASKVPVQSHA